MLKFDNPVLQAAYERGIFVVVTQVTPLYSCLSVESIEPFHLDAFCPPRIALEARKYVNCSDVYIHSITVNEQSCWLIIKSDGELLFKDVYVVEAKLESDFEKIAVHLQGQHEKNMQLSIESLNIRYYSA